MDYRADLMILRICMRKPCSKQAHKILINFPSSLAPQVRTCPLPGDQSACESMLLPDLEKLSSLFILSAFKGCFPL